MECALFVDVHKSELIEPNLHCGDGHLISLGEPVYIWPSLWSFSTDIFAKELLWNEYSAGVSVNDSLLIGIVRPRPQIADVLHALLRSTQSPENAQQTGSR